MEYSKLFMYIVRVEWAYMYMDVSVNMFTTSGWISHIQDVNPLTTDDADWRPQILAMCYQLAQSVLKIGSALAERLGQGEVGRCTALAGQRLQLPVEKSWVNARFAIFLLSCTKWCRKCSFHLVGTLFLAF